MGRLGWVGGEDARVKLDGHTTRGFIYDLAKRGIAAGEWDKYRDALDEDDEDAGVTHVSKPSEDSSERREEAPIVVEGCEFEDVVEDQAVTTDDDGRVILFSEWERQINNVSAGE